MDDKNLNTLQQYVGDMLSLETHIEEALDRQRDEVKDYGPAATAVQQFHDLVKAHREAMKAHLASIGGSESSPVKTAVAGLFGMAAGMVDKMRTQGISKALRDDYTAFNHAAIGYAMLHTTAHALGHQATSQIAHRHLREYAQAVQQINQLIPEVVVLELRKDGISVAEDAASHSVHTINEVWRETSPSHMGGFSPQQAA